MLTLDTFATEWARDRAFLPPADCPVTVSGDVSGTVIFRSGFFQVELLTFAPNLVLPDRLHPNVDGLYLYFSGEIAFSIGSEVVVSPEMWSDPTLTYRQMRVLPHQVHSASMGAKGGCVLSIQNWLNFEEPSSVIRDWVLANAYQLQETIS